MDLLGSKSSIVVIRLLDDVLQKSRVRLRFILAEPTAISALQPQIVVRCAHVDGLSASRLEDEYLSTKILAS